MKLAALLLLPLLFMAIIQYPYYLNEHFDESITIYRYGYYGELIPLVYFPNLQTLVHALGIW